MCENIVKLNYQDKQIYLVKTAHVSKVQLKMSKDALTKSIPTRSVLSWMNSVMKK